MNIPTEPTTRLGDLMNSVLGGNKPLPKPEPEDEKRKMVLVPGYGKHKFAPAAVVGNARMKEIHSRNKPKKHVPVRLSRMISKCPGGKHAWFESNVGLVRKPIKI